MMRSGSGTLPVFLAAARKDLVSSTADEVMVSFIEELAMGISCLFVLFVSKARGRSAGP